MYFQVEQLAKRYESWYIHLHTNSFYSYWACWCCERSWIMLISSSTLLSNIFFWRLSEFVWKFCEFNNTFITGVRVYRDGYCKPCLAWKLGLTLLCPVDRNSFTLFNEARVDSQRRGSRIKYIWHNVRFGRNFVPIY